MSPTCELRKRDAIDSPMSRCAFSLLEVLIAMVLGAFLMLAVFETFFVSARYRILAGESHTRGILLTNALRDLTSDMLAQSSGPIEELPQRSSESTDIQLPSKLIPQNMNFRDTFALDSHLEWTHFTGKKNYIAVRMRAWNSRFSRMPANVSQSGECLVVWWLYRGSPPQIEGWRSKDLPVSKKLKLPPFAKGLIRTQFFIDRTGQEREQSEVILPEAVEFELRYHNGTELLHEWYATDTSTRTIHPAPSAIAVRLKVEDEEIEHWIHIPCD